MSNFNPESGTDETCAVWGFPIGTINSNSNEDIQSIYKALECPVCHEFPESGAIYSCEGNRHMICEKCLPSSKICPGCSGKILGERSYSAEKCIANFLIPCKFKFQGCPYIIRGKEVREHIRNCTYRPITCFMTKCDEPVPFKNLFEHLITKHANKVNGVRDSSKHAIEWWIEGQISTSARWPPFYLTCFNNVFLYMCVSTAHGMWEWVWILADEDEAKRFRVEAKQQSVDKVVSLQWIGPVHSIRTSIKSIVASGQVFITNSKEIRNPFMFRKGSAQNQTKSFWRTEVTIHQVSPALPTSMQYIVTNDSNKSALTKIIDSWTYSTETYSGNLTLQNDEAGGDINEISATKSIIKRNQSKPMDATSQHVIFKEKSNPGFQDGYNTKDPNWQSQPDVTGNASGRDQNWKSQTDLNRSASQIDNMSKSQADINRSIRQANTKSQAELNRSASQPYNMSKSQAELNRSPSQPNNISKSQADLNRSPSQPNNMSKSQADLNRSASQPYNMSKSQADLNRSPSQPNNMSKSQADLNRSASQPYNMSKSQADLNRSPSQPNNMSKSQADLNKSASRANTMSKSQAEIQRSASQKGNMSKSQADLNRGASQKSQTQVSGSKSQGNQFNDEMSEDDAFNEVKVTPTKAHTSPSSNKIAEFDTNEKDEYYLRFDEAGSDGANLASDNTTDTESSTMQPGKSYPNVTKTKSAPGF